MNQLPLPLGKELKQIGMQKALDNAERVNPGWKKRAYDFLCEYVKKNVGEFLAEDVREASKGIVPEAVNKRAWGGIFYKASFDGIICKVGYRNVKNAKAHATPATLWKPC